ncbi:Cyclin-dependent kinase 2-interacting protein [Apodemus speciosus]|uniref:Cyclin-dependent kinase 2-interacting protein n=1 Tax=Apodemus speciosus TaxID=105296 RepID=A0ABQ0FEW6_APOSI
MEVAKTLGIATPRKPVLSVSARKLKDNAADWHNLILKWDSLSDKGFTTASSIANLKVSLLSKEKVELEGSSPTSMEEEEKTNLDYDKGLEALCEELQAILDGLTKIQMKMEKLSSTTKGICELENYHYREESSRPPLFHTWPTAFFCSGCSGTHSVDQAGLKSSENHLPSAGIKGVAEDDLVPPILLPPLAPQLPSAGFRHSPPHCLWALGIKPGASCMLDEVSHRLSEAYKKELLLKHTIGAELAHTADRNLSLTYLSMWLHQPYIESSSKLQLESMLLETGHRTL